MLQPVSAAGFIWCFLMFFVLIVARLNHSKPEQHKHRHRHPRSQPSSEDIGGVKSCKMGAKQCHNDCRVCLMLFNGWKPWANLPPNNGANQQLKDFVAVHYEWRWVLNASCALTHLVWNSIAETAEADMTLYFFARPAPPPWLKCVHFSVWCPTWDLAGFLFFPAQTAGTNSMKRRSRISNLQRLQYAAMRNFNGQQSGSQRSCWSFCCSLLLS